MCLFRLPLPVNSEPQWGHETIGDCMECLCCLWRFSPSLQLNVLPQMSQGTREGCPRWFMRMCLFKLPLLANTELHSGQSKIGDWVECLCRLCRFRPPLLLNVFSQRSHGTLGGCSAWVIRTCLFRLPMLVNSDPHSGQATAEDGFG